MLPQPNRLCKSEQFSQVMRYGCGIGNDLLVVHYLAGQSKQAFPLVGFIVSKKVSKKAVARNRIKRQLREIIRDRLSQLPTGIMMVVRVKNTACHKNYQQLEKAVTNALFRIEKRSTQNKTVS